MNRLLYSCFPLLFCLNVFADNTIPSNPNVAYFVLTGDVNYKQYLCFDGEYASFKIGGYVKVTLPPKENIEVLFGEYNYDSFNNIIARPVYGVTHISVKPGETIYYKYINLESFGSVFREMTDKEIDRFKKKIPEYSLNKISIVKTPPVDETSAVTSPITQTPAPAVFPATAPNATQKSDVDISIPNTNSISEETFALIFANENYRYVPRVDYALNDGKIFAEYCKKTLGIPQNHIIISEDATFGSMEMSLKRIENIGAAYDGKLNIIFYYAGHGIPDEKSRGSYLIPTDSDANVLSTCISTSVLYGRLSKINAKSVVIFMDACFSGSVRGDGMLASARGVTIAPIKDTIYGKVVVFTASNGDQSAFPFNEQGHGIFTYYLLKKLQSSSGNANLGEIYDYLGTYVKRESVVSCGKIQTPTVLSSPESSDWRNWKLR